MARTNQELIHLHGTGDFKSTSVELKAGEIAVRNAAAKEEAALYVLAGGEKVKMVNEYELSAATGDVSALSAGTVAALKQLREDAVASATSLDGKIETLRDDAEKSASTLDGKVEALRTDAEKSASTLYDLIDNANDDIDQLRKDAVASATSLDGKIEALRTDAEKSATTLDEEIAQLRKDAVASATSLDGKIETLRDDAEESAATLDKKVEDLRTDAKASAQTLYDLIEEVKSASTDGLKELSAATKALSANTVAELKDLREDAEASASTLDGKIEKLRTDATNSAITLDAAITALSGNADAAIDALRKDTEASAKTLDEKVVAFSGATVKEIARVDNRIDGLELSSVTDVKYDKDTKYIQLVRKDGSTTTGFDASAFIVDGMLSAVTYDGKEHTMTFIWNTDAGGKVITVDLDDIIAAYSGDGKTIEIEDNVVSAIMDQANGVASYNAYAAFSATTTKNIEDLSGATKNLSAGTVAELEDLRSDTQASAKTLYDAIVSLSGNAEGAIEKLRTDTESSASTLDGKIEKLRTDATASAVTLDAAITALSGNADAAIDALRKDAVASATSLDEKIEKLRTEATASAVTLDAAITALSGNADAAIDALDKKLVDFSGATVDALNELKSASTKEVKELSAATQAEIARLDSEVISAITLNDVEFTKNGAAASATIDSDDIKIGSEIKYSGETIVTTDKNITEAIEAVIEQMVENEEVTAAALNDLDERVTALENDTKLAELSAATIAGLAKASAETASVEAKLEGEIDALSAGTEAGLKQASADTVALEDRVEDLEDKEFQELVIENLSGVTGTYAVSDHKVTVDFQNTIIDCGTYDD